jgi:hypothetical protein
LQRRKLAAMRAAAPLLACNVTQRRVAIGHRRRAHRRSTALWASTVTVRRRLDFCPRTFVRRISVRRTSVHELPSTDFRPRTFVHGLSSTDFRLSDFRPRPFRPSDFRPQTFVSWTSVPGLSSVGLLSLDFRPLDCCPAYCRLAPCRLASCARLSCQLDVFVVLRPAT